MDVANRSSQVAGSTGQPPHSSYSNERRGGSNSNQKYLWYRVGVVAAVVAIVVLLVGIALLAYANNNNTKDTESHYVYSNKLQAVFLNTGQVYFGNIKVLNNNFMVLTNIFYLQTTNSGSSTSTTTSNSAANVTLVKLGCELHRPYDQMIINRAQVTFWENLESGGQVSSAVSTWEQQHPNGQQCTDQSASSSNTSNSVQNATNNNSSNTNK